MCLCQRYYLFNVFVVSLERNLGLKRKKKKMRSVCSWGGVINIVDLFLLIRNQIFVIVMMMVVVMLSFSSAQPGL